MPQREFTGLTSIFLGLLTISFVTPPSSSSGQELRFEHGDTPVTKIYELVDKQLNYLLSIKPGEVDPFAPPLEAPVEEEVPEFDKEKAAAKARSVLISDFGIPIRSSDPVEFDFLKRHRLSISASRRLQEQIAWALDGMIIGIPQLSLKLHVFEFEDETWLRSKLKEGFGLPGVKSDIDSEAFKDLRKEILKAGGKEAEYPSVRTASLQRSRVEMIREFIYPSAYDPPLEKDGGIIAPATPTEFEVRNLGLTWECDPIARKDGSIRLKSSLEHVQFHGFQNFGAEIDGFGVNKFGVRRPTKIQNKILMPVFSTFKSESEFTIRPGRMVVVSGIAGGMDEAVAKELEEAKPDGPPVAEEFRAAEPKKCHLYVIEANILEEK